MFAWNRCVKLQNLLYDLSAFYFQMGLLKILSELKPCLLFDGAFYENVKFSIL